jgi:hypothetical protein
MGREVLHTGFSLLIDLFAVVFQDLGLRLEHLDEVPALPVCGPKHKGLCRDEIVRRKTFIFKVDDLAHDPKCLKFRIVRIQKTVDRMNN